MSRQSLQDQAQPVKRDAVVPLRRFLGGWHVPNVGVVKAFAVGDRIQWRVPTLDSVGRAAWQAYRDGLELQARARLAEAMA